jgi:hypothetical protein
LIQGDPVFTLLAELDTRAISAAFGGSDEAASHALEFSLLALRLLADVYRTQGSVAPELNDAYLFTLSAASLTRAPTEVRDLLVKMLLVNALDRLPQFLEGTSLNVEQITAQLISLIASMERLAEAARTTDLLQSRRSADALFNVLDESAMLARALAPQDSVLTSTLKLWRTAQIITSALAASDYMLALAQLPSLTRDLSVKLPSEALALAGLAAALSEARTDEQVQSAFAAAASPPGGWRRKREGVQYRRLTLTAYPGAYGGYEPRSKSGLVGAYLPVGVEWQFGAKRGHSLSLLASVLNLGPVLSTRLGPSEVEAPTLREVFAPGAHASWGIPGIPLSVTLGLEWVPEVRFENEDHPGALRWIGGIAFDTVLF